MNTPEQLRKNLRTDGGLVDGTTILDSLPSPRLLEPQICVSACLKKMKNPQLGIPCSIYMAQTNANTQQYIENHNKPF